MSGTEAVAAGWNDAFNHDRAVARRSDLLISLGIVALTLLLVVFEPFDAVGGPWGLLGAVALLALLWWAYPGVVVLLRRRIRWRPAFRGGPAGVP